MMDFAAITTFHEAGYIKYGKRMVESFDEYWPKNINLYVYYEGKKPTDSFSDRIVFLNLLDECPDLVEFKNRYGNDPVANGNIGESPNGLSRPVTVSKKHKDKMSFLFNAVRFSHKSYCQVYALKCLSEDVAFWMDADTLTFRPVPQNWIESLLPPGKYCSYLGREKRYSECGFIAYNLKHKYHDEFLSRWKEIYDSGHVFQLKEWHDSYIFDTVRKEMTSDGKIECHNLTIPAKGNHPFINSVLGEYIDHLKGDRKDIGRSPKIQSNKKDIGYWK